MPQSVRFSRLYEAGHTGCLGRNCLYWAGRLPILAGVPAPRAFLLLRDKGEPVATALCVVAEGVAIAECVSTRADRRRIGAASRVMRALEAWGARHGACIAALQAVAANAPARALYAKLAYACVGSYHYRVLDT